LDKSVFTKSEYDYRFEQLKAETTDLDASFIFGRADMFYYSSIGQDGFVEIQDDLTRYVNRNIELANRLCDYPVKRMSSYRVFKEIGKASNLERIGLELDIIPYNTASYIKKALGDPEIVDIGSKLRHIRSVKSDTEIKYLKAAAKQTDNSFEVAANSIEPGMTEIELAAKIHHFLENDGHPGWIQVRKFDYNVTSMAFVMAGDSTRQLNNSFGPVGGQGSCRYHMNGPSHRKIRDGDAILIDTTGVVEGYTGDETRTFFLGKVPQSYLDAYDVCIQIQNLIPKILVNGSSIANVYDEILEVVNENHLNNNFMGINDDRMRFVGHGVGLELDEFPIVTPNFSSQLKTNQVVAMEPKFIFDDPTGGVGIEDMWVVKNNSAEKITNFPWKNQV
ncbi:MAG: M24 family metallopeptidase, partial [Candidatus Kariarchaeaceae archaeon]